jgi:hypothetical protein
LTPRRSTLPPVRGLAGERLRPVTCGGVTAIVGDMRRRRTPSPATLVQYDDVIRTLAARLPSVLPARFGTCFNDLDELHDVLQLRQRPLSRALAHVRNRSQMTVRIMEAGRAGKVSRVSTAGGSGGARGGRGRAYLRQRALAAEREREIQAFEPVRDAVRRWIRDERVEKRQGIASVYHLVPRSAADGYRKALIRAASAAGLQVVVSGPWPPYAFAEL